MDYYDIDNLDHDPALAAALGNMVVAWAAAETALMNIFGQITRTDLNLAMLAYYRIPIFEARVKVIQAMLSEWQTNKYDAPAISKAIAKLNQLAKTRNHWVHNVWCASKDDTESVIFDFRAPRDSADRRRPVKAADVLNHIAAVRRRTMALHDLVPIKTFQDAS